MVVTREDALPPTTLHKEVTSQRLIHCGVVGRKDRGRGEHREEKRVFYLHRKARKVPF